MAVTCEGERLFSQFTGQAKVQLFAASDKDWFLAEVEAHETFETDARGNATQLTIHHNGQTIVTKRSSDAEALRVSAELAARVENQTPQPGAEAALRRDIDEWLHGTPNYDHMSTGLAAVVRQQLPQPQPLFVGFGAVQQISFQRINPDGSGVYDIRFAKGNTQWRILLSADGKVETEGFQPIQ
jgi:hypothetical protein